MPKRDLLPSASRAVILHDFEMDEAFLQIIVLIDHESDGDRADVVPGHFMFFDERFLSPATVLGGGGGREVPFYVRGSADKGDVVEVD